MMKSYESKIIWELDFRKLFKKLKFENQILKAKNQILKAKDKELRRWHLAFGWCTGGWPCMAMQKWCSGCNWDCSVGGEWCCWMMLWDSLFGELGEPLKEDRIEIKQGSFFESFFWCYLACFLIRELIKLLI